MKERWREPTLTVGLRRTFKVEETVNLHNSQMGLQEQIGIVALLRFTAENSESKDDNAENQEVTDPLLRRRQMWTRRVHGGKRPALRDARGQGGYTSGCIKVTMINMLREFRLCWAWERARQRARKRRSGRPRHQPDEFSPSHSRSPSCTRSRWLRSRSKQTRPRTRSRGPPRDPPNSAALLQRGA